MMGVRVKAIGLGLALTAGSALAAGPEWVPAGGSAAGAPGLLPPAVQPATSGPVWMPAKPPGRVVPAGGTSDPLPPLPVPPPDPSVGPRGGGDLGPLPAIPPLPTAEPPLAGSVGAQPAPQPEPPPKKPSSDAPPMPPMMAVPQPPLFPSEPRPLPQPRPTDNPPPQPLPAYQPELEPAPAELMHAAGLYHGAPRPGHGLGTFGSPPLRISRDYPPLREFVGHGDRPGFEADPNAGLYSRFFASGEYLLWWLPGYAIPVLGTTNANTALNGFLGEPGTRSIVGPGAFLDSTRSGFRLRAGAWLTEDKSFGIDAGFFFLGERDRTQVFRPSQFPLITRPIFVPNVVPGTNQPFGENGEGVALPGILDGTLTVQGTSQFGGADVNARWCWVNGTCSRSEVFAGYRYLNLRETLTITENITVVGPGGNRLLIPDPVGTRIVVQDRFATRNQFHGGQIGGYYERRFGRWSVDARASVALGVNNQTLEISGFQDRRRPGMADPMLFRGGLIAAGPNLGRFERNEFSVVPELTLNAGYWLTPGLRVFGGYNFLLWTNVIRPGDQIDRVVDFTLLPNTPQVPFSGQFRPQPTFKQTDLVVNGLQFGVELRW